ncbi:PAS domain S-box protein [Haladaptatus sp. NG-WS-4]
MSDSPPIVVLHMNDDEDVLDLAATFLERESRQLRLRTAASYETGSEMLHEGGIDCMVCDYELGDSNGLDFLETVRATYPGLPFILFTSAGSEEIASRAISAGVTDYIQKELSTEQYAVLANRIQNAVHSYRTENALRESEERYRTVVEGSHDAIYIYQEDHFTFVNERACEITGYDEDELLGMNVWSIVHPDDHDRVKAIASNRERGEHDVSTYEARFLTKDGDVRNGDFSVRKTNYDGLPAAIGSVRDITDRKRTENRLNALIEHSHDILTLIDETGVVKYESPSIERLGYGRKELLGELAFDYIHPDDRPNVVQTFSHVLEEPDRNPTVTYRFRHADGSWRYLETTGENRLEDPAIEGLVHNSRDVTERERREETLEALHDTTRELMQAETSTAVSEIAVCTARDVLHLPLTGIWEYDDRSFRLVARTEEHRTEYGEQDSVSDRSATLDAFESGETVVRRRHANETESEALVPLGDRGVMAFGSETLSDFDVTYAQLLAANTAAALDRAEREDERKANQRELERQNERLEEFASVVSHDLRNPLNVAQGYLDMYQVTGKDDHLNRIQRAHDRMENIVADVLTLARHGQTVSETEPIAGRVITTNAWASVETGEATLDVSWDSTIEADGSRLQQLLENLFRNAIEHAGPDVTVRVGQLVDGFFVADDGPGIPTADYESVFESSYSTDDSGTGFGLTIVKQIAEAHDWRVSVTEAEGGGARFEFTGVVRSGE